MSDSKTIRTISADTLPARAFVIGFVIAAGVFAAFAGKWGIAASIASRAEDPEVAEFAAGLSPNDPQTRFAYAVLLSRTFEAADAAISLSELKAAAELTPHNYLAWIELGRGLERSGDEQSAISAFRRAQELAPNYSLVLWSLGNALLRSGETDESLGILASAGESDGRYSEAAASAIWLAHDGKLPEALDALKDAQLVRARLINILSREKRTAEAFSVWESIDLDKKQDPVKAIGSALYSSLAEAKRFRNALKVLTDISDDKLSSHSAGRLIDGDFEDLAQARLRSVFEWQIADGPLPKIGATEGQKHGGTYALLVSFPPDTSAFRPVSQTAAVEPGEAYVFQIFARSTLSGTAPIKWEVVSVADGKRLGVSGPVNSLPEWEAVTVSFTVPDHADGVEVRLIKECSGACPLEGNLWFDDATLTPADR